MDARFYGFDNIMKSFGLTTPRALEVFYDRYLSGRESMGLNIEGFAWDEGQIDFAYEFGEIADNVTAMATYVDLNSEPLPRGREVSISKFGGYIPRQKRLAVKGENDFRREMIALGKIEQGAMLRGESPYSSLKDYLAKNLLTTMAEFPDSHAQSLTYQVGQMKSKGVLTLTDENNPGGITNIEFKSHSPEGNTKKMDYWTNTGGAIAYEASKTPIEDIQNYIYELTYDGTFGPVCVEIDEATFLTLVRHPEFKKAIGYLTIGGLFTSGENNTDADARAAEAGGFALLTATNEQLKAWFKQLIRVDQVIFHNNVVFVDKFDTSTKKFETKKHKAFEEGVMLIRPVGNIGTIKNVVPLRPDGSAIVAGIFGNRGIIEYRYNAETKTQTWVSELTVLAVPNRPKKMHRLILVKDSE